MNIRRDQLKAVYAFSQRWAEKVDKMTDAQVSAIFFRFMNQGKLKEKT